MLHTCKIGSVLPRETQTCALTEHLTVFILRYSSVDTCREHLFIEVLPLSLLILLHVQSPLCHVSSLKCCLTIQVAYLNLLQLHLNPHHRRLFRPPAVLHV